VERAVAESAPAPLVGAYHPTPSGADVLPLAHRLARAGARVVFPAAAGAELGGIGWHGQAPHEDLAGRGVGHDAAGQRDGARALEEGVLVLAAAVAVGRCGTRIGHGAGYHGRARRTVPGGARIVAVINPEELLPPGSLPREEHVVPIPEVLTGEGLVSLVTSA